MPIQSEAEQFEKIPVSIFENPGEACRSLAADVASLIREKEAAGEKTVLGLATGSTPVPFYRELIRLHHEEGLSFRNVVTFNLDEYYGLHREHRESYYCFMQEQLFSHVDIPEEQINIPPGTVSREEVFSACRDYEAKIEASGGIDLQILGIGRTGHIGFNEPGSSQDSMTRMITLDKITREDAARDFMGIENVPRFALTMGVGTILKARKIVLMAWGDNKASIVARAVEGEVTDSISASFLQRHPQATFFLDQGASKALTRIRLPWLVGPVEWDEKYARRSVTWLASTLGKPVLKMVDEDYNEHGMADLLTEQGPAYHLNIRIFNEIQHTITGWPGGKPEESDRYRPERSTPYPKRVLILSPEPQDEVRSMGGTINRLIEQGHHVEVAFLTSGNLGVSDTKALTFVEVLKDLALDKSTSAWKEAVRYADEVCDQLTEKGPFGTDTPLLRQLKSLIRRGEARHALQACGLSPEHLRFVELPFYEKGRYRRFNPSDDDVQILSNLLNRIGPNQIYVTGRVSDPSSVGGVSYQIFEKALKSAESLEWIKDCRVWVYRAREKELESHEIAMAVPMSPDQLKTKVAAICHYTLEEKASLAGLRDQETARQYDILGLAEYEAIEAFERLDGY